MIVTPRIRVRPVNHAREAERAVEGACLARVRTLHPRVVVPVLRGDEDLIFQSGCFYAACRDYQLQQELITLSTPEQNETIERFFRSVKEESVWQHHFQSLARGRAAVCTWDAVVQREPSTPGVGLSQPAPVPHAPRH